MKKCLLTAVLIAAVLAGPGCKKKQPPPKPMPPASMPPQGAPAGPGMSGMPGMPGTFPGEAAVEKRIVLPDDIRGAWKAVRIEVGLKERKEKKRYVVPLNSEFKVPDTGLTLKPGSFFPHFKMMPDRITSESNRQENPAVQLQVFEGGREVFHGWLFAKFPDIHPFSHDKYAVILIEGIAK
jgi:hypothetical protein